MKKLIALFILFLFVFVCFSSSSFSGSQFIGGRIVLQDTLVTYKDGSYLGKSQAAYTDEPYWGIIHLNIKNGTITDISFIIRDSALHELFNENYEKHFQGNPLYIQQCRNDWKGVQSYPKKLAEIQNPDSIDVISGATWSSNIFKASVKEALKNQDKGR